MTVTSEYFANFLEAIAQKNSWDLEVWAERLLHALKEGVQPPTGHTVEELTRLCQQALQLCRELAEQEKQKHILIEKIVNFR